MARAVKALNAWVCRAASALLPKTGAGAMDTDTKSRLINAALAWVL